MLSIGTKVAGEPTVIPFFYQGLYLSMGLTLVAILFNKNFVGCLCFITFLLLFLVVFYPGITNLVEFDLASRESKDLLYAIYFTVTSSLFAYLISKDKWLIQAVYFFFVFAGLITTFGGLLIIQFSAIEIFGVKFIQQPWLSGRMNSIWPSSTHAGMMLSLAILVVAFNTKRLWFAHGSSATLKFFLFVFLGLGLLLSGSRASIISVALVFLIHLSRVLLGIRISTNLFLLVLGALCVTAFFAFYSTLLFEFFPDQTMDNNKSRLKMWSDLIAQGEVSFFGNGYRSSTQVFNQYFDLFYNHGVIPTALLLVLLCFLFQQSIALAEVNQNQLNFAIILFTVVFSFFHVTLLTNRMSLLIFLFLLCIFSTVGDKRAAVKKGTIS